MKYRKTWDGVKNKPPEPLLVSLRATLGRIQRLEVEIRRLAGRRTGDVDDGDRAGGERAPGRPGARTFLYQVCVPVTEYQPDDEAVEIGSIPGGSYVLCRGELPETPQLFLAARRYAAQHGIAVERGGIEILQSDRLLGQYFRGQVAFFSWQIRAGSYK